MPNSKSLNDVQDTRSDDILILVMGCERAGKSTFINNLLKFTGDARRGLEVRQDTYIPITSEPKPVVIENPIKRENLPFVHIQNDQKLVVVETLGVPDILNDQTPALRVIGNWLQGRLNTMTLGGIIYVHDISADRDTGENARRNLSLLRGLCPEATLDKVVLVTSKWDVLEEREQQEHRPGQREGEKREEELKQGQWKCLLESPSPAHLMRLSLNKAEAAQAAWQVIRHTLWRLDIRLSQQRLAETERLRVQFTKAGKPDPQGAQELEEMLREAVKLQKEVFDLLKSIEYGSRTAEGAIASKEERLKELHHLVNHSLFHRKVLPTLTHKWFAFNSVVVRYAL
ncbi:hypothetical protein NMY22_g6691 [Coprinellus aureogranulatus]|nr:hypothetical protein NMY22_g6691 [Coprinellus aureogranulatus]